MALEAIKRDISAKQLQDYVIVLGDSVFYGSPGKSEDAFTAVIDKELTNEHPRQIYNLSLPASQIGDIYAMLLKLDQYGISTNHLIFNVRYASFVPRLSYESALFWWLDDLRSVDPIAYQRSLPSEETARPNNLYVKFKGELEQVILPYYRLYAYRDYLNEALNHAWARGTGGVIPSDELGPSIPWYEKDTSDALEQLEIKRAFSDAPFDLSERNVDIYFLNKIINHQKMKDTLIVMTGTNHSLMKSFIDMPGYQENAKRINEYLSALPVQFLNLEGKVPDNLFTDHTHLLPEGYRELGHFVWEAFTNKERIQS
ncbi:hypothetical protein [Paenibacillus hexagrammi]|uniref:SGNH/GDSL hydrolase family protein n=1 Tax=Paenibacillus hexagrammi TaxID=2908839 RepID=A0ABY3SJP1_9BACL|nr:hypothetical protein [Paenibacillus sp. YPD9-1]UJF33600.1 hypothetical protein L0M14_29635 [Paenibacillus sp. YPD9-1]